MQPESVTRRQALAAAWAIAPGVFVVGLGGGIVFPILPLIGVERGLSLAFIGLILAANRIGRVIANPLVGMLVDRHGGKRMLVIGLFCEVAVMGVYWLALLSRYPGPLFLVGRLLYGPASAMAFVGGQTLGLLAGGSEHRGVSGGVVRMALSFGTPAGLVVGGILAGIFGNSTAFGAAMGVALIGGVMAWRTVPDLRTVGAATRRLRQVAANLSDIRIVAVSALNAVGSFSVTGILLSTLVLVVDSRHIGFFGLPVETSSGLMLACLLGASAAFTPLAGRLADRPHGRAPTAIMGLSVMVVGFAAVGLSRDPVVLLSSLVVIGIGLGSYNLPLLALISDLAPADAQGSAVGTLQLFGDGGGTFGPIAGTAAFAAFGAVAPYLATAGLLALGLPVAGWLAKIERVAGRLQARPEVSETGSKSSEQTGG